MEMETDKPYEVMKLSPYTVEVDDRVLTSTSSTRLIIRPTIIVANRKDPDATVKIDLIHQRKSPNGQWEDVPGEPQSTLKAGQEIKLTLKSGPTLALYQELEKIYKIAKDKGHSYNKTSYVLNREDEVIKTIEGRTSIISSLLSQGYSDEVWKELIRASPDLVTRLSYARIQEERKKNLEEFKTNLGKQLSEPLWQIFFEKNTWIFGYGLSYKFLNLFCNQPHYGGAKLTGKGMERGDFFAHTEAETRFTVLLEIKRPDSRLLGDNQYRNGAWQLGSELVGGVSQIQANCSTWEIEGSRSNFNREKLQDEKIYTVMPKGILVIGQTEQLKGNIEGRNTFERFRRSLSNPEVITYDELYERAKFIVGHAAEMEPNPSGRSEVPKAASQEDDIPF